MITIDDTHYPILLVASRDILPGEAGLAVEQLAAFAARAQANKTKLALLVCEGDTIDAKDRKIMSQKVKENPQIETQIEISVVVVNNALKRGALTALLWLVGTKPPTRVASSIQAAFAVLRSSSVRVPERCTAEYVSQFSARAGLAIPANNEASNG